MKKTNFQLVISSIFACFILFANVVNAQKSPDRPGLCGTESFYNFTTRHPKQRLLAQPGLREKSKLGPTDPLGLLPCNPGNILPEIPLVVHVMHVGEAVGAGSNISVAQINDAIRGLNDRWSKITGDGVPIPIRFALAKRAPDGSPSTGIVRYNAAAVPRYLAEGVQVDQNGPGADNEMLKDLSKWPPDQYYNIWVVRSIQGNVLGFANYPLFNEAPYPYDGTVISSNAMVYNSITLAHEMGHAFNLAHTFEGDNNSNTCPVNTDCSVDGDGVCDTPPHREDDCGPTNPCSNMGIWDNSRINYMSYCGNNISTRFTAGQVDRILHALGYSSRNTLPLSLGNSPTGNAVEVGITAFLLKDYLLCDSSFSPQIQLVNYGTQNINTLTYTLTLDNISLGTFTLNPNLAAGASQAVALQQLNALSIGTHELSIVITGVNGNGDGAYDYDNSICVKFERRGLIADFCAEFEGTSDLPEGFFTLATPQIKPKTLPTTCDAQGSSALEINGTAHNDTSYTAIIGPIDFSKNGGPQLFFDLARQGGFYCNTFAEMKISVSSDCGNKFEQVYYKNDAPRFTCGTTNYIPTIQSLATTTRQTDPDLPFNPNSCQQWRKEIVDMEAYAGQKVFIKFEFLFNFAGSKANTIFLDNICVNNCTKNTAANITVDPAEKTSLCRTGTLKLGSQVDNLKGTNILWEAASSADGVYNSIGAKSDTSISAVMNTIGKYYFRVVSIKGGCADTSKIAEVTVNGALRFETHPVSVSFCNKSPVALTSEISPNYSQLSYQWQRSNALGGTYTNIPNATQSAYTPTTPGVNYYRVRARSADSGCTEITSFEASTTVDDSVDVKQDPEGFKACIGGRDTLTVLAAGNQQKYFWQQSITANGIFQQVGVQSTYIPDLNTLGTRYFRVIVHSERELCKDTSEIAEVSIVSQASTSVALDVQNLCESSLFSFQVPTQGGIAPLIYQWQKSTASNGPWADITDARDSVFYALSPAGTTYYRMQIQSMGRGCIAATTNAVAVNTDAKTEISREPRDTSLCIGLPANLSVSASNPTFIQWQVSEAANGPFSNLTENTNSFRPLVNATGDKYYRVFVRNGLCSDTSSVVNVKGVPNIIIGKNPQDANACEGTSISTLMASAKGGGSGLNYQWQSSDSNTGPWTNVNNARDSIYQPNSAPGVSFYRMFVSSQVQGCTSATSSVARVEIVAPISIVNEPVGFSACVGSTQTLQVNTSNPGLAQYQWQSSNNGQNGWKDLGNGQNARFNPPSNFNYTSTWYRVLVKDGSVGCGADTSLAVMVDIRTDFKIQKTLEICNNNLYGNNATVNFATLIMAGDLNSRWRSLDTLQNNGVTNSLDFSNWTPGKTYRFVATTNNAVAPCTNVSDTLSVLVKSCCPSVCSTAPSTTFCTEGSVPIQLQAYLCANSEASGNWSVTAGPGITSPRPLSNATFDPKVQIPGLYTLTYQLAQNIQGCQTSSAQNFNIVGAIDAGNPLPGISACNQADTIFGLASLLNNESAGGIWSALSGNPGQAFNSRGTLRTKGLSPGIYRFQYRVQGSAGCASDSVQVELNLQASPSVALGTDIQLTCAIPFRILSTADSNNLSVQYSWKELSENRNISNPNSPSIRVNRAGVYVLNVRQISNNCSAADTIQVSTAATFITAVNTEVSAPSCNTEQNASILVKNVSGGKAPFSYFLNGQPSNSGGQFRNLKPGVYSLLVMDANNCSREETFTIAEASALDLTLSGPSSFTRCEEPLELKINTNLDSSELRQVQWLLPNDIVLGKPDAFTRIVSPKVSSVVKVSIVDLNGCRAESQLFITVDKKTSVYLPNAFSPTGNKGNQVFKPMAPVEKIQKINSFRIMDRWGNQVLEQIDLGISDERLGWDGRSKNGVYAQGVYVYVAEVTYCDGSREKLAGEVMLLK